MSAHFFSYLRLLFVSILVLSVSACGGSGGGGGNASSSSNQTESNPTGSGAGAATLNWTPPTENADGTTLGDLTGYKIYYGTNPYHFTSVVEIDNPGVASYIIDNLPGNNTYYFAITAYDADGDESTYSNTVSKFVP